MGNVYIFRGKAAIGKSTLANTLAKEIDVPVIRKDDIVDALKTMEGIDKSLVNNTIYYNILHKIIQTNLDLGTSMIIDIALGDKVAAEAFFNRVDFGSNKAVWFFVICSDDAEWERRHLERLANPLPNQSFTSFEHVQAYYENADVNPYVYEYIVDTVDTPEA